MDGSRNGRRRGPDGMAAECSEGKPFGVIRKMLEKKAADSGMGHGISFHVPKATRRKNSSEFLP